MARVAANVTCNDQDRKELERLGATRTDQALLGERAKTVLGCLAGERNDQIAARMKVQWNTVAAWRKRFLEGGIKALGDRARSGKPPTCVASDLRERIRRQLELAPPEGLSSWGGTTLAQAWGCRMTPSGACALGA